jgi:hypothetical protein
MGMEPPCCSIPTRLFFNLFWSEFAGGDGESAPAQSGGSNQFKATKMARKKDRAFYICPRWNEIASAPRSAVGQSGSTRGTDKIVAAIRDGQPVARSTLRKALLAARYASGSMFDVDDYMVDRRTQAR